MPTIQEEMSKVLTEWNQPTPQPTETKPMTAPKATHPFAVSNNVCRVTFDYVKNNPGTTATEASNALIKKGFKQSSVTSIMAQMFKQGLLRKDGFKYYAAQAEYVPIKAKSKKIKLVPKIDSGIASLSTPAPAPFPVKPTAKSLLDTLTVKEARELYLELKEYFGG